MTKKKIIAIILFLFLSLFMFTFANPGDIEPELKKPEKTKEETKKEEVKEDTEEKEETTQTVVNQNTNNSANNNSSNETNKKHLDAPVIKVPEGSLVILLGESYDVMEGVKVISEENLTATADITDTSKLPEGKHTITYTVTDSEGNSATATREVVVLDPNKDNDGDGFSNGEEIIEGTDPLDENDYNKDSLKDPEITLLGSNPYVMLQGETYEEAGVEITVDEHDTETTIEDVETTGEVNAEVVGDYTLTYTITDKYENSKSVERAVKVLAPDADEDGDGFTNEEEMNDGTNPLDKTDHGNTKAPEITLLGSNPYVMLQGETYEEAGVKIELDEHDTETKIEDVETTGEVNAQVVGDYTLTYTITDKYENSASVERIVKVLAPDADEDGDRYSNIDEINNGFDPLDDQSHPAVPTLTLHGQNPYPMLQNQENDYVEAGYNYTVDPTSSESTVVVTGTDSINKSVVGNYEINYSLTDKYGVNVSKVRTVKVLAPDADEDGDRINNGEEFEDGTDPLDPNSCKYTVTFYGYNNTLLKTEKVNKGQSANAPILADDKISINGFEFKGWNPNEFVNIQSNLDVYAIYVDVEPPRISFNVTGEGNSKFINATVTDNVGVSAVKILSGNQDYSAFQNNGTLLTEVDGVYSYEVFEDDDYTIYAVDVNGNESKQSVPVSGIEEKEIELDFADKYSTVNIPRAEYTWWLDYWTRDVNITSKDGSKIVEVRYYISDSYVSKSSFETDASFGKKVASEYPTDVVSFEIKDHWLNRITVYVKYEKDGITDSRVYRTRLSNWFDDGE